MRPAQTVVLSSSATGHIRKSSCAWGRHRVMHYSVWAVHVLSLWYASVCVLFTLSSGDVSWRMKRCNCHDWLSDQFNRHFIIQGEKHSKPFPPLSLASLFPHTSVFLSLSLPLSSAGSPIFLALSCWQAIWSEPKIKLYPGSWGCWWREEQRFQLRPCVWESVCVCVCVCVSATGWLGNWCDSFVALVIPACRSRVL